MQRLPAVLGKNGRSLAGCPCLGALPVWPSSWDTKTILLSRPPGLELCLSGGSLTSTHKPGTSFDTLISST